MSCVNFLAEFDLRRGVVSWQGRGWDDDKIHAALEPVLDDVTVPVRYVVASGEALGSRDDWREQMRATLDPVLARNPNLKVSAKVASNHGSILRKDSPAVADPRIEELATAMADHYLANPTLLGNPTSPQAWTIASTQYRLINYCEDQAPISARLTALTETKLRSAGVPIPHQ